MDEATELKLLREAFHNVCEVLGISEETRTSFRYPSLITELGNRVERLQESRRTAVDRSLTWENRFEALADGLDADVVERAKQSFDFEAKRDLKDWLSTEGSNFLGTGMSFQEWFVHQRVEEYANSFAAQDRDERRRRLNLVIRLGRELCNIREENLFSTMMGESAIEAVILGKWDEIKDYGTWLSFKAEFVDDPDQGDYYSRLWSRFREILAETYQHRLPPNPVPEIPEARQMMVVGGWEENGERWHRGGEYIEHSLVVCFFERGVRWIPSTETEPGHWCRADGERFKQRGDRQGPYRLYDIPGLLMWARS